MAESKETLNKIETSNFKLSPKGTSERAQTPEKEHGLVDVQGRMPKVPENIKTWLQKIEEDPGMANPIGGDDTQQILTPSPPQNPKIVLPVTRTTFIDGFKKSFDDAGRWLSTFLLRLIKMKKGNVKFNEE